jgi:DNA excision repair protein ERCC-3
LHPASAAETETPRKGLRLIADNVVLAEEIRHTPGIENLLAERLSDTDFFVKTVDRGKIKQELIRAGFPAEDLAGYVKGERVDFAVRAITASGVAFLFSSLPATGGRRLLRQGG